MQACSSPEKCRKQCASYLTLGFSAYTPLILAVAVADRFSRFFVVNKHDVVVFVHGMNNTRGEDLQLLRCVVSDEIETEVTLQAQEVIGCLLPPETFPHPAKNTVKFDGCSLPSVARRKLVMMFARALITVQSMTTTMRSMHFWRGWNLNGRVLAG